METTMNNEAAAKAVHPFEVAGLGKAPFRVINFLVMKYQACHGAPVQPGASCDFCGTGIMNVYMIVGADNGKPFKVGCDCVAKTGDHHLAKEVKTIKKQQRDAKKSEKRAAERQVRVNQAAIASIAFLVANPEVAEALALAEQSPILKDMEASLKKYGKLTDRQMAFAVKLAKELREPKKEIEFKDVVAGRREITAEVLATKYVTGYMGENIEKMLIVTDDGQKIFGSVPSSLRWEKVPGFDAERPVTLERGTRIKLTVSIEQSPTDSKFGFFKRPKNAVRVSEPARD